MANDVAIFDIPYFLAMSTCEEPDADSALIARTTSGVILEKFDSVPRRTDRVISVVAFTKSPEGTPIAVQFTPRTAKDIAAGLIPKALAIVR